ncbi:hypothetical protein CASFOL_015056 [Castilleja foliolosa]|uniref:Replication factor A C-terminal domain-containing protein n=1 Tax=Castilleja foliolosa TaxID=1961234 RepID=A0ABD3DD13_9LAMI
MFFYNSSKQKRNTTHKIFQTFKKLSGNTDGVKVRVIRCYRQPPFKKTDPDGTLELLVLHDEIEDRIHATMDYGLFKEKKLDIVEGSLYKIRDFMVAHDMSSCRSTPNPLKLRLYKYTTITPFQDSDFPTSMYRFRDLWEIANDINVDNFKLLDVIGRVVSYQKPTFVAKCSTRRMNFTIANTENRKLGCSLWGDYIDPVLPIFEQEDSKPIIICIQFGKITRYRGDNKWTWGCVQDFSGWELGSQNNVIAEEIDDIYALFKHKKASVRTIDKLARAKDGSICWIDGTIFEIQTKADWYYRSCKSCFKKMPKDERNRQCFICGEDNFTDNFRYKIVVGVADSGGCASLLMWDSQCTTLIGKSAKEMKQLNEKSGNLIPFEIQDSLMDKRVLFEIKCPAMKCNSDLPQYKDTGNEASSRLRKGKENVDCDDTLENQSDAEEEMKLAEGEDEVESEENLDDEDAESGDDVPLKDLQGKKTSKPDAKYSSRKKRVKVNPDN